MLLAIRVDVDTLIGLREGVPRLLELFRRHSLHVSFFVSFGPDSSGRALRRIVRPSFVAKMWRTNAIRLYGFKTLLSGTVLPSRLIGEGEPALVRDIVAEGHELGIHGYDHVRWQDRVERMGSKEIAEELTRASEAYRRVVGFSPESSAAPGWRCTSLSLGVQERFGFLYASDVRGRSAFLPSHNGLSVRTLQLPTTLPTLDELLGRRDHVNDYLLSLLGDGLNVHTVHAEVEGRYYLPLFEELVGKMIRRNISIVRLRDIARMVLGGKQEDIPRLPTIRQTIPGRSGWVALQGLAAKGVPGS